MGRIWFLRSWHYIKIFSVHDILIGKGKVEFAGGKNANLDLDLLKSKGISTKGIDFGRLHHAEPRAVQYMLKNNIPTDNAVQVVSRKSCDSCSNLQYNLGWKRRR